MALAIFPVSPLPGVTRAFKTNAAVARFDSGARQAFSPWTKPLYRWSFDFKNVTETKQNTLASFSKDMFGPVTPFLIKDPYDYIVNSVQVVPVGATQGNTLQTFDTKSFHIRIDTVDIPTITSALSGFVTLGTEFQYDQDTGIITLTTYNVSDEWSVQSVSYFRKAAFEKDYSDTSRIWNIFAVPVIIEEIV